MSLPDCEWRGVTDYRDMPEVNPDAYDEAEVPENLCGAIDYLGPALMYLFGGYFYNCPLLCETGLCPEGWR